MSIQNLDEHKNQFNHELNDQTPLLLNLLQKSEKIYQNVNTLDDHLGGIQAVLNQLKDEDYEKISKELLSGKKQVQDVLQMNFYQIIQNQNKLMLKSSGLRNSFLQQQQLKESIMDFNLTQPSTRNMETSNLKNTRIVLEKKDLINQIEINLIDQNVLQACEKYEQLIQLEEDQIDFDFYIKRKNCEKMIIEQIVQIVNSTKIKQQKIEFSQLEQYTKFLIDFKQYLKGVKLVLSYASKFLAAVEFEKMIDPDNIAQKLYFIIMQTIEYINSQYKQYFENKKHIIVCSQWIQDEIVNILNNRIFINQQKQKRKELLEEFMIYSSEFDRKGFCIDFLIKQKIQELGQFNFYQQFNIQCQLIIQKFIILYLSKGSTKKIYIRKFFCKTILFKIDSLFNLQEPQDLDS